ncbi:hypothetical protein Y032_1328g3828, partial [Ancylostoma ceylanicum]
IERKKLSLKEGGEYEDSALLLAIAAHYKWINDVIAELVELLPALVRIDELELASSVQSSVDRLVTTAVSRRPHIWPQKLHPRDLPGPLYAMYSINDVFVFPEDGGMPGVITLGKFLHLSTKTCRKWSSDLPLRSFFQVYWPTINDDQTVQKKEGGDSEGGAGTSGAADKERRVKERLLL